jgi:hypothetical protein
MARTALFMLGLHMTKVDRAEAQSDRKALLDKGFAGEAVVIRDGKREVSLQAIDDPSKDKPPIGWKGFGVLKGKIVLHPGWDDPWKPEDFGWVPDWDSPPLDPKK